jgi:hypothetical protein
MADLENGIYPGWSSTTQDQNILTNPPFKLPYLSRISALPSDAFYVPQKARFGSADPLEEFGAA